MVGIDVDNLLPLSACRGERALQIAERQFDLILNLFRDLEII